MTLNTTNGVIRLLPRPPLRWIIVGLSVGMLAGWIAVVTRAALRRRRDEPWRGDQPTGRSTIGGPIEFVDIDRPDSRGAPVRR